jgi:hypothetical protein
MVDFIFCKILIAEELKLLPMKTTDHSRELPFTKARRLNCGALC